MFLEPELHRDQPDRYKKAIINLSKDFLKQNTLIEHNACVLQKRKTLNCPYRAQPMRMISYFKCTMAENN